MKGSTKKKIEGYLFIFPWIIGLSVFVIYPAGYGLVLGFFKFDIFNPPKWIALRNFQEMFTEDPNFLKSLSVTVRYIVFSVSLRVGAAFFLALLLNQKVKGLGLWRTLFYTPSIVAGYALALLWNRMMDPQYGLVNVVLRFFGGPTPNWFGSEHMAFATITVMSVWSVGPLVVIFLAGLQGIPRELYEQAEIDGAKMRHRLIAVTLPMISPVLLFNLVIGCIHATQLFVEPLVMTGGGPNNATLTLLLYLYRNAFTYLKMGYAAAIALIMFLLTLGLTVILFRWSRRWVYYAGSG